MQLGQAFILKKKAQSSEQACGRPGNARLKDRMPKILVVRAHPSGFHENDLRTLPFTLLIASLRSTFHQKNMAEHPSFTLAGLRERNYWCACTTKILTGSSVRGRNSRLPPDSFHTLARCWPSTGRVIRLLW